jgi:hypothetical protein
MKQAQMQEAPLAKRKLCLASLAAGAIGIALAAWALKIDAMNNFHLGAQFSPEAAQGMIMAAIGVGVIPILAVLNGWEKWLRITWTFAVALTIIAAVASYMDRQGTEISAKQGAHDRYQQAQADAVAARKELAEAKAQADAIAEAASVEDLQAMVARHRELAQTEAKDRGGRGKLAKAHEDAEQAALARVPAARAKAAAIDRAKQAQARLDAAQGETKAGPVNQNPLAIAIATATGQAPEDAARLMASVISFILIAMTVTMGMLVDASAKLMRKGLGFGEPGRQEPQEVARAPKPVEPVILTPEQRLAVFIGQTLRREGETTAGQLYEAFSEWWRVNAPGELIPSQVALSRALEAAGIAKERRAGKVRYQAVAAVH